MLTGRVQHGLHLLALMDLPARVETFGLFSFACCLLGSLASPFFPLAINVGVALLALVACRSRSEAQLLGYCGAVVFTLVTDLLFLFRSASAWGAAMIVVNVVCKLGGASNAYRLCSMVDALGNDDELSASEEGGSSRYPSAYQAPLAKEDYQALAAEAASACHLERSLGDSRGRPGVKLHTSARAAHAAHR
jgi:hypothetical protein